MLLKSEVDDRQEFFEFLRVSLENAPMDRERITASIMAHSDP